MKKDVLTIQKFQEFDLTDQSVKLLSVSHVLLNISHILQNHTTNKWRPLFCIIFFFYVEDIIHCKFFQNLRTMLHIESSNWEISLKLLISYYWSVHFWSALQKNLNLSKYGNSIILIFVFLVFFCISIINFWIK